MTSVGVLSVIADRAVRLQLRQTSDGVWLGWTISYSLVLDVVSLASGVCYNFFGVGLLGLLRLNEVDEVNDTCPTSQSARSEICQVWVRYRPCRILRHESRTKGDLKWMLVFGSCQGLTSLSLTRWTSNHVQGGTVLEDSIQRVVCRIRSYFYHAQWRFHSTLMIQPSRHPFKHIRSTPSRCKSLLL